ncbi:MAG: cobalamin-dependent protein, partial [Anaerolineae bacterium]|nr:cobalamin-dependent protein [Caldilineales bacterium]MDW8270171.1 cobalamin-dependent protein [Anaerolineae bacterium]
DILRRGLITIGEGWHAGRLTVQQEHFASELAVRRLEALIAATQPTRPGRILLGCPPEEVHTFTVLLLSFLLRRRGWHTLYLGANIPLNRFETALEQARPQLVILGAQLLTTAATLADMADLLLELRVPLAFGGLVFTQTPGLVERIPGYYLGHRLEDAPMEVEKLLSAPPPLPKPVSMPPGYAEARSHFLAQVPHIHMRVNQLLTAAGLVNQGPLTSLHLFIANTHLAQSIHAALRLGDLNFLRTDISWIQGLLAERHLPEEALRVYIQAYYQAAVEHLDSRGAVIVAYLRQLAHPDTNNGHHGLTLSGV